MNTFGLEVYASNKLFFSGRAAELILPSADGERGILAHHEDMFVALVPGSMRKKDADGNWEEVIISNGFAEIVNNRVKVFVLTAERPDEIDKNRAREAKERAQEQLRQKQSIQEYHINQMALVRAMARLRAGNKGNHNI